MAIKFEADCETDISHTQNKNVHNNYHVICCVGYTVSHAHATDLGSKRMEFEHTRSLPLTGLCACRGKYKYT